MGDDAKDTHQGRVSSAKEFLQARDADVRGGGRQSLACLQSGLCENYPRNGACIDLAGLAASVTPMEVQKASPAAAQFGFILSNSSAAAAAALACLPPAAF